MNLSGVTADQNILTGMSGQDVHFGRVFAGMFLGEGGGMQFAQVYIVAQAADPSDPSANMACIWQSDGTGSGADGDIMIKITDSSGTTKTATLIDFSGV